MSARAEGVDGASRFPDPDHDVDLGPLDQHPIWQQENVTLRSVGIDIGSSGTQAVFSEVVLQRNGAGLATRFVVVERQCRYQSPITFTPFGRDGLIDAAGIGEILDRAYAAAALTPGSVDTGVVILTGEALRRENAEKIARVISERAGEFVCAAAGHHMEAALAAFGSGSVLASREVSGHVLNVDIGGGTTKLSLLAGGEVIATAALHVGGRLVATDADGRVVRLEDAGRDHARAAGIELHLGALVTSAELDAVATKMADTLVTALAADADPALLPYLTEPITSLAEVTGVIFSGGVAEFVYGTETRDFGDLGRRLGQALARRLADGSIPYPLLPAAARIRATALGASEFSVQLSGSTCYISDVDALLPRRNVQVVRPNYDLGDEIDVAAVASSISAALRAFGVHANHADLVLALAWSGRLTYRRLHAFAQAVASALATRTTAGYPLLLATDADIGRSLGSLLDDELRVGRDVLVVDGLNLLNFDYIDLGRPLPPAQVLPVTIKSLIF